MSDDLFQILHYDNLDLRSYGQLLSLFIFSIDFLQSCDKDFNSSIIIIDPLQLKLFA